MSTSGGGWASGGSYGVKEVTLEEDALIVSYGEKKVRYQLPLRSISSEELLALNPFFEAFQKAKKQYWYEMDWSSDVAIPMETIKESHRKMMRTWDELEQALVVPEPQGEARVVRVPVRSIASLADHQQVLGIAVCNPGPGLDLTRGLEVWVRVSWGASLEPWLTVVPGEGVGRFAQGGAICVSDFARQLLERMGTSQEDALGAPTTVCAAASFPAPPCCVCVCVF